jgi:hypothetical protein
MYQLLENYIRLVFENEENKRQKFIDILNNFASETTNPETTNPETTNPETTNPEERNKQNQPIKINTDQIGFDRLIKNARKSNQTR